MTQLVDNRGNDYKFEESGSLYLKQDPDQSFILRYAKPLDVGMDLPVKILVDEVKFTEAGEEKDKLRDVHLQPSLRHYIFPNGVDGDNRPFFEVPAHGWAEIPSGLSVKLPNDAWGMFTGRSSTGWNKRLQTNLGVIDPGYIGRLGTLVFNPNNIPIRVYEYDPEKKTGDRLAQMILIPKYDLKKIVLVDKLPDTERGNTGFGSSII